MMETWGVFGDFWPIGRILLPSQIRLEQVEGTRVFREVSRARKTCIRVLAHKTTNCEDYRMNKRSELNADPRKTLFDFMDNLRTGMLGVVNSDQHMQPMTHFLDRENAEVWFITSKNTDLVRAVGLGARADYCLSSPEADFYACLSGTLEQSANREKLDEIWSAVTSAWFDEGREDPDVCLLKFTLLDAGVWATTDSSVVFGLEIARANIQSSHQPDLGEHTVVRFGE